MSIQSAVSSAINKAKTDIRLDIQALRAIAVIGVLIYHINPSWLSGGLIGVDVFFVLSGYLISAHLISELQKKGKIDFASFWARRVKRLLPASMTVLLVSLVGVLLLIPDSLKNVFYRDIIGATFYVANWIFAGDSSDYFAADNAASPVLHFWSLGVEEQFYLFWPLLLVGGWFILGKIMPKSVAMSTAVLLFAIPSLSLAITMVLEKNPAAYYVTTTRVWEFGAGALIAILLSSKFAQRMSSSAGIRITTAFGWVLGFVTIFAYMVFFKTEYGFPGLNAIIPVLATVLVLIGKPSGVLTLGDKITGLRPIQYTGAISYSIYLWHWVLLVFTPYILVGLETEFIDGGIFASAPQFIIETLKIEGTAISDLTLPHIAIIVALTFVFAGLTTKYVENPIRFSPTFKFAPNWSIFVAMLIAMFALAGAAKLATDYNTSRLEIQAAADAKAESELAKIVDSEEGSNIADLAIDAAQSNIAENADTTENTGGTLMLDDPAIQEEEKNNDTIASKPASTEETKDSPDSSNKATVWTQEMCAGPASILVPACAEFSWNSVIPAIGAKEDTAGTIKPVWMDGEYKSCLAFMDNYAPQHCIYGVLDGTNKVALVGDSHAFHWLPAFNTYAKNNSTQLHFFARSGCPLNMTPRDAEKKHMEGCLAWSKSVQEILVKGGYDTVVISNYGNTAFSTKGYSSEIAAGTAGYKEAWKPILNSGAKVIVLKDTPFIGTKAWDCAVANPNNLNKCSVSEKDAFKIVDERLAAAKESGVPILDMTKYFCRNGVCPIEIGGVRVYRDSNHMTGTYNLLLSPYLAKELAKF